MSCRCKLWERLKVLLDRMLFGHRNGDFVSMPDVFQELDEICTGCIEIGVL